MPEIRLGAGANMADIQLGSVQIEEVRIGNILVWRNNARPMFTTFTVDGANVANGDNLARERAVAIALSWTAQDMEPQPPNDNIVAFRVIRNGGTPTPVNVTTPSDTESGTFTIVASTYTAFEDSGVLPTPEVWRVEAEDDQGSVGFVEFNITELTFDAPTISPTTQTFIGRELTHTVNYTVTPAANAINLNTTDNGSGTSIALPTVTCDGFDPNANNTSSVTLTATTAGDNGSSQSSSETYTYSATESTTTVTLLPGTIQSGTETISPTGTCTATSTTSCGETLATCTNQPGSGPGEGRTPRTQEQRTRRTLLCDGTNDDNTVRVSISDSIRNIPSGVACNDASYTNPGQLPVFPGWAVPTITQVAGGNGACTVTCQSVSANAANGNGNSAVGTGAVSQSTLAQGSTATISCGGNIPTGFQNAGATAAAASTSLTCNMLPTYTATVTVADGTVGDAIGAGDVTISDGGTFVSSNPATYQSGTNTYTITVSVPNGFFNSGGTVTADDDADGTVSVPNITGGSVSFSNVSVGTASGTFAYRLNGTWDISMDIDSSLTLNPVFGAGQYNIASVVMQLSCSSPTNSSFTLTDSASVTTTLGTAAVTITSPATSSSSLGIGIRSNQLSAGETISCSVSSLTFSDNTSTAGMLNGVNVAGTTGGSLSGTAP